MEEKDMTQRKRAKHTPANPNPQTAGHYMLPEAAYHQLQEIHGDLRLLALLAMPRKDEDCAIELPLDALANGYRRAADQMLDALHRVRWEGGESAGCSLRGK
jgi:hypothetical protein